MSERSKRGNADSSGQDEHEARISKKMKAGPLKLLDDGCTLIGDKGFRIELSPGSKVVQMERAISGHMMHPCSDFSKVGRKPQEQKEINKQWILYPGGPSSSSTDAHMMQ